MTRLRTYTHMKRQLKKTQAAQADFTAVYRLVDQRSEGWCEFWERGWQLGEERDWAQGEHLKAVRCPRRGTDHHHLVKPRRLHHVTSLIVHLCREHHNRCEWPYQRGRLVVTALCSGRFAFAIRYSADKFMARGGPHD